MTGNFQGFADASNTLFGAATAASQNLNFSKTGISQSFAVNDTPMPFSPNGATYSLSIFANYTLGGGSALTLTGGNEQAIPSPEPTSMVSALIGLGISAAAVRRRRRKAAKA